ncbi:hypothetical protein FHS18_002253 [Paenibacillus phyllosphaerae]|uniref:Bacterial transcription activator effector binding domain-containing protein n=1 Tax=Paenibacillus phyllosphaerae TaxID=274593 RepID=A0A7W5FMF0_9BACL|nr:effector binding domain-containing protein [Paenibacillus phyllosphaerae]MBB3110186.1 hypothetical protein [Paenibacillus phyllosphaerae]
MTNIYALPDLEPRLIEHGELKLIGIPCIGLDQMGAKFELAKRSLLDLHDHLTQIIHPRIHYGVWPQAAGQELPASHAYLLCVEVSTFDQVPEWFVRITLPPQHCVAAASMEGDFDAASRVIDAYLSEHGIRTEGQDRPYVICERYRYDAEGFARYSLPLQDSV